MQRKKLIQCLTQTEKIILTFLAAILLFLGFRVSRAFYIENTDFLPLAGGVYTEGAVGQVGALNPLFIEQGSVSHDLTQLVFSGLTKYNPKTGQMIGDLADFKVSSNGQEYTFVIKENALWHDGKPVTAADVAYTYTDLIQNPEFKGTIPNYIDFSGIKVAIKDERTVQFLLDKPDSFFLAKTRVGLLPKHLLDQQSVALMETAPYNFSPIGSGPYKFTSQTALPEYTEYSLTAFENHYAGKPNIDNIIFKVFDDYPTLEKNMSNLDGIRNIPKEKVDEVSKKNGLEVKAYHLPQYVAIFINNESETLKEKRVRLALQLGTDKESLIKLIDENKIIGTPLLEIDQSDWRQQYSISKANGALFDTQWQIPNKEALEQLNQDQQETPLESGEEEPNYITGPNGGRDWQTTHNVITITGTVPQNTKSVIIRESNEDYTLQKYNPGDPNWFYAVKEEFGNLKEGENTYEVYTIDFDDKKTLIDSIVITYGASEKIDEEEVEKIEEENKNAQPLPTRINQDQEPLVLKLITSKQPAVYQQVAQIIKLQWQKIGVEINIEVLENQEFQRRLVARDYDLLLFGQNLGYNPDTYPYWHSSQTKEEGLNLSQFKSFVADTFLERARLERDEVERKETLKELQSLMSDQVPAVFLYSPTYYSAFSQTIQNVALDNLATPTDRLALISEWNSKGNRKFKEGTTLLTVFTWLIDKF